MNYWVIRLSSLSILLAILVSLLRRKDIGPTYYPFLVCLWIGLFNEIASEVLGKLIRTNAYNSNIYSLLEAILLTLQFRYWGLFAKKYLANIICGAFVIFWSLECLIFSDLGRFCSYFMIGYSFIIVLMSIQMVNTLIVNEQHSIIKNPCFLICIAWILYFTFKVLVEIFWLYGLSANNEFGIKVFHISTFINLFSNFIFALAFLWMPRKQEFIPRF